MGFSTSYSRSTAHVQGVLKIVNSVSCDMSLWSNGGNTGVNNLATSPRSLLEVLKVPRASKTSLMLQYNN
jgi:hypothetical protein